MTDQRDNPASKEPGPRPLGTRRPDPNLKRGPAIKTGIAEADKRARTGTAEEPVRNTPPAGAWNDTSSD
jgi:hypothetical protein